MKRVCGLVLLLLLGGVFGNPSTNPNDCTINNNNNNQTPLEKQLLEEVHPQWVRERCQEPFYATKFQPFFNTHHPINDVTITNVEQQQQTQTTTVTFSDNTACTFSTPRIQKELSGQTVLLQSNAQLPPLPPPPLGFLPPLPPLFQPL